MDYHFLKDAVRDLPDPKLLEALDRGAGQADIISLLTAEVRRSTFRLQRLREIQNSLSSPVYRLLPEILSDILYIYADDNRELLNLRWTRILLVCRRWYDISMNTPKLWSFIHIGRESIGKRTSSEYASDVGSDAGRDARRIETQRARAGDWPLTVSFNTSSYYQREAKDRESYMRMFWNPSSLLFLSITSISPSILKILRALSTHSHPNLRSLTIQRIGYPTEEVWEPETRSVLDGVLRDNVPNLQDLLIIDVTFDWAFVKGLRLLHVDYMQTMHHSFSVGDIIGALSRSPLLENLQLKLPASFSSAVGFPFPSATAMTAELAHASSISLTGTLDVCTQLLQALAPLPCGAVVTVITHSTAEDEVSTNFSLASYLGEHARQENAPVIRSVMANFMPVTDGRRMMFGGQYRPGRHSYPWPTAGRAAYYIFSDEFVPRGSEVNAIAGYLRPWPLSNTAFLDVRVNVDMEREWWDALLAELPAASTVIVRPEHPSSRRLVETLLTMLTEGRQSSIANIIFDVENLTEPPLNMQWVPRARLDARMTIMRALFYCADAARAGSPLDTLEVINEPAHPESRLFGSASDLDWSKLYEHLKEGFIYEGTLYGPSVERAGVARDSFAML